MSRQRQSTRLRKETSTLRELAGLEANPQARSGLYSIAAASTVAARLAAQAGD